jgi:ubiquinone/menaquinone biosynthesis C-methylase UbiE
MPESYIDRTINAYNTDPATYIATTAEMILAPELDTLISLLPDTNHAVLDAGCAYGRDAAYLTSKDAEVMGIDYSDAFVTKAHEMHPTIPITKMDVRKLDFPDQTFGGVWCNAVLLHLNDQDIATALREFNRVVVPGGVVLISFKEGTGEQEFVEALTSHNARHYNYQTKADVERFLLDAGFKIGKSYLVNEQERFGADKRNLNWIYTFGVKPK